MVCSLHDDASRRCLPEVENGDVGDPWVPIDARGGALTVGSGGFHYGLLAPPPVRGRLRARGGPGVLRAGDRDPAPAIASALSAAKARPRAFTSASSRCSPGRTVAARGPGRPGGARQTRLTASCPRKRSAERGSLPSPQTTGTRGLSPRTSSTPASTISSSTYLFATLGLRPTTMPGSPGNAAAEIWRWHELQRAIDRCACRSARRFKAISDAERMFDGCLKKNFPDLLAVAGTQQERMHDAARR